MTACEHAQRIVDNYTSHGLGDPRKSTDHAVAVAVAFLDREKSICALPELTDEERRAMDAIDLPPILGTPAERLKRTMETAVRFMRRVRDAEATIAERDAKILELQRSVAEWKVAFLTKGETAKGWEKKNYDEVWFGGCEAGAVLDDVRRT